MQTSTFHSCFPAQPKTYSSTSPISMPYSHIPSVSESLVEGSRYSNTGYSGTDVLRFPPDHPRSPFAERAYSSPRVILPAYVEYAQSLHQQQLEQQRVLSETSVDRRSGRLRIANRSTGLTAQRHQTPVMNTLLCRELQPGRWHLSP
jgi:hypothetical protein